jgi:hypothetical protein
MSWLKDLSSKITTIKKSSLSGGSNVVIDMVADPDQPPIDTGTIWRTGMVKDVCKWLRQVANEGKWPSDQQPFFIPTEPTSIERCATEIEKAFLGDTQND